jgi:parvulin-like peptidyl-prolyl isomerase
MVRLFAFGPVAAALLVAAGPALAQQAPAPRAAAAVVNGQPIPEHAVQRALERVPKEHQEQARQEILSVLIDNLLVEQHLIQLKIEVSPQEVDDQIKRVEKELKEGGSDLGKVLEQLKMSEAELREQVTAELRWEKYIKAQVSDQALAELFQKNREWFDGSQVRARHILVGIPEDADAKTHEAAKAKLLAIKRQIEGKVAQELAKLDPKADNLTREHTRQRAMIEAFAEASKDSDCPSKKNGGDLGLFPRIGAMVEPFADAAFKLQVGQLSEPVLTEFGYHLILVTARQPGQNFRFEDVKEEVRDVYAERLRQELLPKLHKAAKIDIPKPQ